MHRITYIFLTLLFCFRNWDRVIQPNDRHPPATIIYACYKDLRSPVTPAISLGLNLLLVEVLIENTLIRDMITVMAPAMRALIQLTRDMADVRFTWALWRNYLKIRTTSPKQSTLKFVYPRIAMASLVLLLP